MWLRRLKKPTTGARLALGFGLAALALVAVPLTMYMVQSGTALHAARQKLAAIAPLQALLNTIRLQQQHRGLSGGVPGGNRTMAALRATRQIDIDRAVKAFDAIVRSDIHDPASVATWHRAVDAWRTLSHRVAAHSISGRDSFAAHTALIADELKLLDLLVDDFGLLYDPTARDYHLMMALLVHMPNLTESLGQARARGVLLLTARHVTLADRTGLIGLITAVQRQHWSLERELTKAIAADPQAKGRFGDLVQHSLAFTRKATDLAQDRIVEAEAPSYPPTDYFAVFTEAIDGQFALLDAAMVELHQVLQVRLTALQQAQFTALGLTALLTAFAVWLGIMIVRALRRDVAVLQQREEAQRHTAQQLTEKIEELRRAQTTLIGTERLRAMGQMASGVAHDFNNILAGILGQVSLLQTRLERGSVEPEELRRNLGLLERAAIDGAEIVRKIREATRPHGEEAFVPIQLNEVVRQVLETTRPRWKDQAEARGLPITLAQQFGDVPPILGSAAELREAFTNLLFNALDAMPKGGMITIATKHLPVSGHFESPPHGPWTRSLTQELPHEREWVELVVTDTGQGMSPEVKARLFEPFFTTKGVRGTGLGLSMVQGIVRRHWGEISITSAEDWGTSVIVRLPAALAEPAAAPPQAQDVPLPSGLRLLVIDDEPVLAETLADLLRLFGYETVVETSGQAGLARLRAEPFDGLITDLGMPEISGWEVARASRASHPDLPVILVTGWGDQLEPAQLVENGIDAVVAKPYTIQSLLEGLSQAWSRVQSERGHQDRGRNGLEEF